MSLIPRGHSSLISIQYFTHTLKFSVFETENKRSRFPTVLNKQHSKVIFCKRCTGLWPSFTSYGLRSLSTIYYATCNQHNCAGDLIFPSARGTDICCCLCTVDCSYVMLEKFCILKQVSGRTLWLSHFNDQFFKITKTQLTLIPSGSRLCLWDFCHKTISTYDEGKWISFTLLHYSNSTITSPSRNK